MLEPARIPLALAAAALLLAACDDQAELPVSAGMGPDPQLPPPEDSLLPIPTIEIAEAVGWEGDARPVAATDLAVTEFASGLQHPRWIYVLPNGDVLVAETNAPERPKLEEGLKGWVMNKIMEEAGAKTPSADRITLLRDQDGDGYIETRSVFLNHLNSPFGMALLDGHLYVANTDALVRFPYREGAVRLSGTGETVVELPAGPRNQHWTRNVVASPDGETLFVTVGSNSNIAEHGMEAEQGRAAIWAVDPETGDHRIFASGLRNPNGMDFEPETGALWTAVNERDGIGSDLVPDYMTSVEEGDFFGWPWSYFGDHVDERVEPRNPQMVEKAIAPDYALGPHTASLGLVFADGAERLPPQFREGVFVGQHGSWNRQPPSGYKVIFVPFSGGQPSGSPVDVLTGFLNEDGEARGRPVGVAIDGNGALLVADDVGNRVWRVSGAAQAEEPSPQDSPQTASTD